MIWSEPTKTKETFARVGRTVGTIDCSDVDVNVGIKVGSIDGSVVGVNDVDGVNVGNIEGSLVGLNIEVGVTVQLQFVTFIEMTVTCVYRISTGLELFAAFCIKVDSDTGESGFE